MSSDNGSWIYFVIMVVLSIIGSISKSKDKKVQKQSLPKEEEESEESFPPVFFPEQTKPKKQTEFVPSVSDLKPREFLEEGTSAISVAGLPKTNGVSSSEAVGLSVELNIEHEGEIRKAIIYSEIFNRKYF